MNEGFLKSDWFFVLREKMKKFTCTDSDGAQEANQISLGLIIFTINTLKMVANYLLHICYFKFWRGYSSKLFVSIASDHAPALLINFTLLWK